jgi:hypothetical protein
MHWLLIWDDIQLAGYLAGVMAGYRIFGWILLLINLNV